MDPASAVAAASAVIGAVDSVLGVLRSFDQDPLRFFDQYRNNLLVIGDTLIVAGDALGYMHSLDVPQDPEGDLGDILAQVWTSHAQLMLMLSTFNKPKARLFGPLLQAIEMLSSGKGRLVAEAKKTLRDRLQRHGIIGIDDVVLAVEQLHDRLWQLCLKL